MLHIYLSTMTVGHIACMMVVRGERCITQNGMTISTLSQIQYAVLSEIMFPTKILSSTSKKVQIVTGWYIIVKTGYGNLCTILAHVAKNGVPLTGGTANSKTLMLRNFLRTLTTKIMLIC